jgi:alpha-L-fucosidase
MLKDGIKNSSENRMKWWFDAKFGMFIHWGLYSIPAGKWGDKKVSGIGEWIMKRLQIPIDEYEKLTEKLNPVHFNAKEWVEIAKSSGMKYIIITSKHHDGFAMYHSANSKYNIVDATPYKRDPIMDLSVECKRAGIKLGFYYSQTQDWHEENGIGNDWDFPEDSLKDFSKYLNEKVKPQLHELLTQYGPVSIIWFDTPLNITNEQSRDLVEYVHQLQPECIVNGRVGNGYGDYLCFGDNEIPAQVVNTYWETCATLNDTWGFKEDDNNWKSSVVLKKLLVDIVSKGGTYLLNVGPTAEGIIPRQSIDILREVGIWLEKNGEAITGTKPGAFQTEFDWGAITTKPGKIFIHLFDWPTKEFLLYGLKSEVKKAYLLAEPNHSLKVIQKHDVSLEHDSLVISLPKKAPDKDISVLVLEIEGEMEVNNHLIQKADCNIVLNASRAKIRNAKENSCITLAKNGVITNWSSTGDWLSWDFKVFNPGVFNVEVMSLIEKPRSWRDEKTGFWESGHEISIKVANQEISCILKEDRRLTNPRSLYFKIMKSNCGQVTINETGDYTLTLTAKKLNYDMKLGLKLRSVNLSYSGQTVSGER